MAVKKFYAVKKGRKTGVFSSWDECKASVDNYPGAIFKGFVTLAEAKSYLKNSDVKASEVKIRDRGMHETKKVCGTKSFESKGQEKAEFPPQGTLLAYVDGSYEDTLKKYAFGCVFLLPDGRIFTEYGNGDNAQSLQLRNVTGEMLGAMYAVRFAMLNGFDAVEIRYDYSGIEKWVSGEWRSRTELTQKYAASMREWGKSIAVTFTKVAAHTNVKYNELADQMAKKGITEGNGVPKVRRIEEMTIYEE